MVDLWRDSLRYMRTLHAPNPDDLGTHREKWDTKPRMTLALARLVTLLTDVKDLAVVIHLKGKQEKISKLHEILAQHSSPDKDLWIICRGKNRGECDPREDWTKNRKAKARTALVSAITAKPKEMFSLLLDVDDVFQNIRNDEFFESLPQNKEVENRKSVILEIGYDEFERRYELADYRWDYYCDEVVIGKACEKARKFGIVSVPNLGLLEELQSDIRSVKKAGGVGLDTGRLPQGLDTLIEEYLRAAKSGKNEEIGESGRYY